ncbi:multidrug efflux MFS transporter [Actinomycetospora sp. TBRC 11914]|nr:multidrug efflux MFS transporter [Actinomycetospora sp. TBRC 11914]
MSSAPTTSDAPAGPAPDAEAAVTAPGTTRAGVVIAVLVVSAFVMILNETILSVALKDLTVDLGVSTTTVQWLTSGFLLTMAVVIPTTGFLLERFTPRQVFLASLTLFSLGTLISALAPGFPVLLVGRVVQACGTAVMIPLLMTSIMRLVPPERRGSTMGTITIVIAVAPAIGPTIGGAILASLSWRWMFWIVLPLAVAALVLGAVLMRLDSETRSVPLDLLSVLLSAIGFGGILYGFSTLGESGGSGLPPWVPIVVGAVALVLFVWRQLRLQRRDAALLDLRPFTHRQFVVALVLFALLFMSLLGAAAILLPLFLQTVLGQDTFWTGLAVLPGGLVLGLLGRPVGALYDRVGARPLVIPGAIMMAVALWLFTLLGAGSPLGAVVGIHVVLMAGLGLMMTPLMTEGLSTLPGALYSHGSAILATLQQVAGAFGTAAFVTISAIASVTVGATPDAQGLRVGFMAAGVVGVLAVIVSLFLGGKPQPVADRSAEVGEPLAAPPGPAPVDDASDHTGPVDVRPSRTSSAEGPAGVRVRGQVDLAGPGEAVVTLVDEHGAQHGRAGTRGGRYELVLPTSGAWLLVVSAPGHAPTAARLVAEPGITELTHDATLPVATPPASGPSATPREPQPAAGS